MPRVRTSGKGAVVIPKSVRDTVGLEPGQLVEVAAEGTDRIVVRPLPRDPIEALDGILRGDGGGSVADFLRERRREENRGSHRP
ncbi:MAG: AbrB/MazE/SpoVT family DNA-binding domain-containing protein [Planctomycetes bacterium]|nr:AbrB/MazE/SpoVT family DNA-binding domain-containing protein [Planctomycetota bacterium]